MSYQVLARQYRPATFQQLEGQEHVLQALINALDQNRLHHAYLFTGTRGVGKTTIARIVAKCLNCAGGVTSTPCGECDSCVEIAGGRSLDLIEVDAASRTGVDDMRELLDNVQYMPSSSRFKVYLIDEVHMLSKNSFNAMLKTLEEPPEHVKFLFATTDPKKLPITVLSRCLQFNLKNLSPEQIVHYLTDVLAREDLVFEEDALWQLARAADGSMRDALSLTDQAISYGDNTVTGASVMAMLGSMDQHEIYGLLEAVSAGDAARVLSVIAHMAEYAPDYAALLDDILGVLHRVTVAQLVPAAIDNSQGDKDLVLKLVGEISKEDVQLLYQIGVNGQKDLAYAPDDRRGFEMTLLRMLVFTPLDLTGVTTPGAGGKPASDSKATRRENPAAAIKSMLQDNHRPKRPEVRKNDAATPKPGEGAKFDIGGMWENPAAAIQSLKKEQTPPKDPEVPETDAVAVEAEPVSTVDIAGMLWHDILGRLGLTGVTQSLAMNCSMKKCTSNCVRLVLHESHASLWNKKHEQLITRALSSLTGHDVDLGIEIGLIDNETPSQLQQRLQEAKQARAVDVIQNDEVIQTLIKNFNGRLDKDSIKPIQSGDQ